MARVAAMDCSQNYRGGGHVLTVLSQSCMRSLTGTQSAPRTRRGSTFPYPSCHHQSRTWSAVSSRSSHHPRATTIASPHTRNYRN
eukprot:5547037-Prorocentrum_lima.AAC.1